MKSCELNLQCPWIGRSVNWSPSKVSKDSTRQKFENLWSAALQWTSSLLFPPESLFLVWMCTETMGTKVFHETTKVQMPNLSSCFFFTHQPQRRPCALPDPNKPGAPSGEFNTIQNLPSLTAHLNFSLNNGLIWQRYHESFFWWYENEFLPHLVKCIDFKSNASFN